MDLKISATVGITGWGTRNEERGTVQRQKRKQGRLWGHEEVRSRSPPGPSCFPVPPAVQPFPVPPSLFPVCSWHRMSVSRRIPSGDEVLELALDVGEQGAGAEAEEVGT